MTPLAPIVPLVIAGLVAWRLVTRSITAPAPKSRARARAATTRRPAMPARNNRAARARKKRNGG